MYDSARLAQPDEVANYTTADGLEKALLLANVIRQREPDRDIDISVDNADVVLQGGREYAFVSAKGLKKQLRIAADGGILARD